MFEQSCIIPLVETFSGLGKRSGFCKAKLFLWEECAVDFFASGKKKAQNILKQGHKIFRGNPFTILPINAMLF